MCVTCVCTPRRYTKLWDFVALYNWHPVALKDTCLLFFYSTICLWKSSWSIHKDKRCSLPLCGTVPLYEHAVVYLSMFLLRGIGSFPSLYCYPQPCFGLSYTWLLLGMGCSVPRVTRSAGSKGTGICKLPSYQQAELQRLWVEPPSCLSQQGKNRAVGEGVSLGFSDISDILALWCICCVALEWLLSLSVTWFSQMQKVMPASSGVPK